MTDPRLNLPPIGQIGRDPGDHTRVVAYIAQKVMEAKNAGDESSPANGGGKHWSAINQASANEQIYAWGGRTPADSEETRSNAIQDDVNAITDYQTKEPPELTIDPAGGPVDPIYFARDPAMQQYDETGQPLPVDPKQIAFMTQGGDDPHTGLPMLPTASVRDFIAVDPKFACQALKRQADVYWRRGRLNKSYRLIAHNATIWGFVLAPFEWRDGQKRPKVWTNIALSQIYVDPTVDEIEEANYCGVDWLIDKGEAKQMFPHLADVIEAAATRGIPSRPDGFTTLGANVERTYQRDVLIMRVWWERNQPIHDPLSEQEAIDGGHVQIVQRPVGAAPNEQDEGADVTAASGSPGGGAGEPPEAKDPDAQSNDQAALPDPGVANPPPDQGAAPLAPATRSATVLAGTDTEVDPDHPDWPASVRYVNRQTIVILNPGGEPVKGFEGVTSGSFVAEDDECPYWDIPMLHTVCIPMPTILFGQGLPQKLESLQGGHNRVLTSIVQHAKLFAHPVQVYPESAWAKLDGKFKRKGASIAGAQVVVPDEIYLKLGGKLSTMQPPEPISESLVDLLGILGQQISDRSANSEVTQGKTPPGVSGWQAIQLLQQSSENRWGFSIQWNTDMLVRMAMLTLHCVCTRTDVQDWCKLDGSIPPHVMGVVKQMATQMLLDDALDVEMSINSAVGAIKSRKKAEAQQLFSTRDPNTGQTAISMTTYRETMGLDDEEESQRNRDAVAGTMTQPAAGTGGAGGAGESAGAGASAGASRQQPAAA